MAPSRLSQFSAQSAAMKNKSITVYDAEGEALSFTLGHLFREYGLYSPKEAVDITRALVAHGVKDFRNLERAAKNPDANKLTKFMYPHGWHRYRYFPGGWPHVRRGFDRRGWEVRFCWSTVRNAAGYFLSWEERIPPETSKAENPGVPRRTKFAARKSRKRAKALALRRSERFTKQWKEDQK